jgi:hypothetical protein
MLLPAGLYSLTLNAYITAVIYTTKPQAKYPVISKCQEGPPENQTKDGR